MYKLPAARKIYVWQLSQFRLGCSCLPAGCRWFIVCQYTRRSEYPARSADSPQPLRILVSHRIRGIIRHRPVGRRRELIIAGSAVVITRRRVVGVESESGLVEMEKRLGNN